jgi:hypothetical protein
MASPGMREVLEALEWVRGEMWRFSSPDFIRQRELERKVGALCAKLVRGGARNIHRVKDGGDSH